MWEIHTKLWLQNNDGRGYLRNIGIYEANIKMVIREIWRGGGKWCTLHDKNTFRISQLINKIRHLSINTKKQQLNQFTKGMKKGANNYCLSAAIDDGKSNSKSANFFLDKHSILNKSQFGLRKNKSSNDANDTIIESKIENYIIK